MENWILRQNGYTPEDTALNGNRFLCANGYMGMRGTLEEDGSRQFAAVTLANVYDQYGNRWREPVNVPRGLSVKLNFDGRILTPDVRETKQHVTELDYRYGLFSRNTDFGPLCLQSERFLSMADCHLMTDRLHIRCLRDGMLEIHTGISADIWDINGPHLFDMRYQTGKVLCCEAVTGEKKTGIAVAQCVLPECDGEESFAEGKEGVFRIWRKRVRNGEELKLAVFAAVWTSLDCPDWKNAAEKSCLNAERKGFDACLREHIQAWNAIRDMSEVVLEGMMRQRLRCGPASII